MCFLFSHARLRCSGHPAFPAPSVFRGQKVLQSPGVSRRWVAEPPLGLERRYPRFREDDEWHLFAEQNPHSSLALLNANDDTRLVFSSRIRVRVIGGSARWLQFSRSQSRQLTPIGVPSAFSRSMPAA